MDSRAVHGTHFAAFQAAACMEGPDSSDEHNGAAGLLPSVDLPEYFPARALRMVFERKPQPGNTQQAFRHRHKPNAGRCQTISIRDSVLWPTPNQDCPHRARETARNPEALDLRRAVYVENVRAIPQDCSHARFPATALCNFRTEKPVHYYGPQVKRRVRRRLSPRSFITSGSGHEPASPCCTNIHNAIATRKLADHNSMGDFVKVSRT